MSFQDWCTIGDYQIIGVLGAGGMGKVYKVKNTISDRMDALKVLLPNLADDPELADRFMREIKVLASLNHPNIAGLRTAFRLENQLLMVMEYVEGTTLDERPRPGPSPWPTPSTTSPRSSRRWVTRTSRASFTATSSLPT